jgi:hypothetical protein
MTNGRDRCPEDRYLFINLNMVKGQQRPPLSWFLSKEAQKEICFLPRNQDAPPYGAIKRILLALGGPYSGPKWEALMDKSHCD